MLFHGVIGCKASLDARLIHLYKYGPHLSAGRRRQTILSFLVVGRMRPSPPPWHCATAAAIIASASLVCSGCGPLGWYSLGHSILVHNHVLKPILPDIDSSCGEPIPMEVSRQAEDAGALTVSGETNGEEACRNRLPASR